MRTIVTSCLFAPPEIGVESLSQMRRTMRNDLEVWVLDQHWPINKSATSQIYKELCQRLNFKYLDAGKNLGLHHGYNYIFEKSGLTDGDLVLCHDPDLWVETVGWDATLAQVMNGSSVVWAASWNHLVAGEQNVGWGDLVINGVPVKMPRRPCIQSLCGFQVSWLKKHGWFWEGNTFYGGLEVVLWNRRKFSENMVYLPGVTDNPSYFSPKACQPYVEYKWAHAHDHTWSGDFESYLLAKHPSLIGDV